MADRRRLEGVPLTQPELEVLKGVAEGLSAKETAQVLVKSEHTVISQRQSIQAKLGARNLPHAVALAFFRRILFDVDQTDVGRTA
jgi:DNA-binding CsgD family transcriptional regulator